ncbi:hypothetical protein WMY93_001021 [Mugilogobius chulae]|uniref:Uncharacterized protein n=1 Tax=Mugilogobius chulae TaxID=88201 RepID=A0AAW0Q214_9GOBI
MDVIIGHSSLYSGSPFSGMISDLHVWDHVLYGAQIQSYGSLRSSLQQVLRQRDQLERPGLPDPRQRSPESRQ